MVLKLKEFFDLDKVTFTVEELELPYEDKNSLITENLDVKHQYSRKKKR